MILTQHLAQPSFAGVAVSPKEIVSKVNIQLTKASKEVWI